MKVLVKVITIMSSIRTVLILPDEKVAVSVFLMNFQCSSVATVNIPAISSGGGAKFCKCQHNGKCIRVPDMRVLNQKLIRGFSILIKYRTHHIATTRCPFRFAFSQVGPLPLPSLLPLVSLLQLPETRAKFSYFSQPPNVTCFLPYHSSTM